MYLLNKDGLVWFFQPNGCLLVYHRRYIPFPIFPQLGVFSHRIPTQHRGGWKRSAATLHPQAPQAPAKPRSSRSSRPRRSRSRHGTGRTRTGLRVPVRVPGANMKRVELCVLSVADVSVVALKWRGGGKFWCVYAVFFGKSDGKLLEFRSSSSSSKS